MNGEYMSILSKSKSPLNRIATALEDMNSILAELTIEVIDIHDYLAVMSALAKKQLAILNITYKEVKGE